MAGRTVACLTIPGLSRERLPRATVQNEQGLELGCGLAVRPGPPSPFAAWGNFKPMIVSSIFWVRTGVRGFKGGDSRGGEQQWIQTTGTDLLIARVILPTARDVYRDLVFLRPGIQHRDV